MFGSRSQEIIAYFEPIEKTFSYDYGYNLGAPFLTNYVTLNRNAIDDVEFLIPERSGYTFCGWYADKEYRTRITNETGRYMYGYASFSLESNTLYAKWQKEGETENNHKILLIFVDEIKTTLYSSVLKQNVYVESKMTALEYEIAKWTVEKIYDLLNEWFRGDVIFEVDSYYTTKTITKGFKGGTTSGGNTDYQLFANRIAELMGINYAYHNTITTIGCHDYEHNLFFGAGTAGLKDACVVRDSLWSPYIINNMRPQDCIKDLQNNEAHMFISTYIHEFVHTAEMNYGFDDIQHNSLHRAEKYALAHGLDVDDPVFLNVYKLCLLGKFEMDGLLCGIPMEYWKHEIAININYVCEPINGESVGRVEIVGENHDVNLTIKKEYISGKVTYGTDLCVKAIPKEGYRFVAWSDGVTTAVRHDRNIIACVSVNAIFEKA